jgi:hypothetical protein
MSAPKSTPPLSLGARRLARGVVRVMPTFGRASPLGFGRENTPEPEAFLLKGERYQEQSHYFLTETSGIISATR